MVLVHLQPVVIVIVCHAIATDGGVGGVLDHGLWVWLSFSHWRSRLASLAVTGQTQVRFLVVRVLSVLTIVCLDSG